MWHFIVAGIQMASGRAQGSQFGQQSQQPGHFEAPQGYGTPPASAQVPSIFCCFLITPTPNSVFVHFEVPGDILAVCGNMSLD